MMFVRHGYGLRGFGAEEASGPVETAEEAATRRAEEAAEDARGDASAMFAVDRFFKFLGPSKGPRTTSFNAPVWPVVLGIGAVVVLGGILVVSMSKGKS